MVPKVVSSKVMPNKDRLHRYSVFVKERPNSFKCTTIGMIPDMRNEKKAPSIPPARAAMSGAELARCATNGVKFDQLPS